MAPALKPAAQLENIRVLDLSRVFAMPFAAANLADLGAEVIKVDTCQTQFMDTTRTITGPFPDNQAGELWWEQGGTFQNLNRGKRSLTLDLRSEESQKIIKDLVGVCDIVLENFTPRVMSRFGLDFESLRAHKPDLIMVSNTGYGHGGGPYSSYPAQATTQEATHGHCWITGYKDQGPSKAGASFVDFLSTWTALFAIGSALRYRNKTGQGQWADIGMYQAGVMFMSEYIMDAQVNGREGGRIGNRHPYRAPQGCYRALGDDQWITLSVGDDEGWAGMCGLMGRPELTTDPMYADLLSRQRNHDQIDEIITTWTSGVDRYELMHALQGIGIPAGPVLNSKDVHYDPQFKSRGFLERVDYPRDRDMGSRMFIGRPWKFSNSPLAIQGPSPTFGQHNEDVLQGLLGVDADAYQSLVDDAVVATVPTTGEATPRVPELESLERGLLAGWDPDYLQKLGLA